jgi:hypothetical protein
VRILGQTDGGKWVAYWGDCVDVVRGLDDASIHYTVMSVPFSSLYTYSASPRDFGNCTGDEMFFEQMRFLAAELYRVTKPGRLVSTHCMLLPKSKQTDGVIGLKDFRGDLIRAYEEAGFTFHSEVCIWKDPVTAMQRTKALGLLHKQIRKDSAMSRQGIADWLVSWVKTETGHIVTVRKDGENDEPIAHTADEFPVEMWQRYASPVWATRGEDDDDGFVKLDARQLDDESSGINPSDTLQYRSARDDRDERHIAPLQLSVIRRCVRLWTNPGDTVLSPFMGIGSEGYVALKEGRRFVGAELKESYFKQAVRNLEAAVAPPKQSSLFDLEGAAE